MTIILRLVFIMTVLLSASCDSNDQELYCQGLIDTAKKGASADLLEDWAVKNIFTGDLQRSDIKFEGRVIPGLYRFYGKEFEWSSIGFDSRKSQVRLVGPHPEHVSENGVSNIKSVFFAERSRYGYLVKEKVSGDYGVGADSKHLTSITDNVAVLCVPRD